MCFKPKDVPSKKVVLVELERTKVGLEQENSVLKLKLKDLQASATRAAKDRDSLICQRTELESQLQQRSSHASHLLTQITCLRTNLTSTAQEILDQYLAGPAAAAAAAAQPEDGKRKSPVAICNKVNVHVAPTSLDCIEAEGPCNGQEGGGDGDGDGDGAAVKTAAVKVASNTLVMYSGLMPNQITLEEESADNICSGVQLSVQQQLDRELEALARAHQRILEQSMQFCSQLQQAESEKVALRADMVCARRRLEQVETNAADQQQVLQLRCAALEQENEQLTGMNEEMQQRLEGAQGELSAAKKQWSSDGAQLAKQAAELQTTNSRLRELEAEIRVLQSQLATATEQAQDANGKVLELQAQAAARASSLDATGSNLAAREAELTSLKAELHELQTKLAEQEHVRETLAAEVKQAKESEQLAAEALGKVRCQLADTQQELAAAQRDLAATQRDLAAARREVEVQTQALIDTNMHLQESRTALAATSDRLSRALEEVASSEARAAEANTQYLSTKQSVISTAKQLATMAKDHSTNLAKLHSLESETASLREQLAATRAAEAALRAQVESSSAAAKEAREAAETSGAEARRLRVVYDTASADLRRKIMLLTAIARMADKGQAAGPGGGRSREGQAVSDPSDGYGAVTSEQQLRLKICESPLPLLGALTAGIMDSSRLRHLALDMDTSREVTWEKAGLRICCLAAAIGLNNSLQTLQLGGWTWGELGNGTALPFLALGGGGGGGAAGGMLRSVQLATNLFDLEAAAMLKDLLAAGLVELAAGSDAEEQQGGQRTSNNNSGGGGGGGGGGNSIGGGSGGGGGGQGVLYLYSGNDRLDGWYRDMLLLADHHRTHSQSNSAGGNNGSSSAGGLPSLLAIPRSAGPSLSGSVRASAPAAYTNSLSASSVALSVASLSAADDVRNQLVAASTSIASFSSHGITATTTITASAPVATAAAAVDCDLSSEALESHHMVLVMTVLLTCRGMRRLKLDGNKLGDGGAALLALGLASNTGLRELYLSRNGIRAAGARSLARCLEAANSTLLRLDLSGQRLEGIGAAGAEAMAQALRTNRALEDLNLSSCGLAGAAAACFAGAIRAAGATTRPQSPTSSNLAAATSAATAAPSLASSSSIAVTGGNGISPRSITSPRSSNGSGNSASGGGGGGGGSNNVSGGALRRLGLSGNGIDAATSKALMAAAAERPGLTLSV